MRLDSRSMIEITFQCTIAFVALPSSTEPLWFIYCNTIHKLGEMSHKVLSNDSAVLVETRDLWA